MPNMTTSNNNPWLLDKTIAANEEYNNVGRFHASLSTAGSLLDRNIELDIDTVAVSGSIGGTAAAGKATAAISNVNSIATIASPSGTAGTDYWEIKATATGTAGGYTPKYTVSSAGWLHSTVTGTKKSVSVTGDTTGKSLYIPKATFANNATSGITYVDISDTAPALISGDYLYINKGYTSDLKISLAKLVPDWDSNSYPNVAAANHILSGYVAYDEEGNILTGTIANGTGITFSDETATAAAGYYATAATANMTLAAITSGKDSITSGPTYTYNSTNSNFNISIGTSIAAPSVGTAGFISSTKGTRNTNTNTLTTTVAKIKLETIQDSGNLTMAPTLTRTAKPSGDTWTDAASGAETTTKPSSGPYVQIDAAANTNVLKIKGKVKTAGYGTITNFDTDINDYTVGAAKATTTYIPITTATPAFDGGALTVNSSLSYSSNVQHSTTNNGISISSTGSASRAAVLYNGAVHGWVDKSDNATALAATSSNTTQATATTEYITGIIVPNTTGFNLETQAKSSGGTIDTNVINIVNHKQRSISITSDGGGWITIDHNSTAGTDKINAYIDNTNKSGLQDIVTTGKWVTTTVTPKVSGDDDVYYGRVVVKTMSTGTAAAATVSATTQAPAPTIARTATGTRDVSNGNSTTTAPSSGYYVAATATVADKTFAAADITKTINTAGYLGTYTQITASANLTTNTSSTYYIPVASNTITGSTVDLVAPSVAITTSTSSGLNISNSATSYYVEITGTPTNGSVKGKATAGSTIGIVAAGATHTQATATTITPTITGSGSKVYLTAAAATVTATKKATAPSITTSTTSITGASRVAITPTTTSPSSGYYVAFKAQSPAITNFSITKTVNTAGYLSSNTQITATTSGIKTTASDNIEYYVPMNIAQGSILTSGTITTQVNTTATNKIELVTATNKTNDVAVQFEGSGTINLTTKTTTAGYSALNATTYATGSIAASSLSNTIYYAKGVIIDTPSSGTSSFYITVPNGNNGTVTFNFHVDSNGEVTID